MPNNQWSESRWPLVTVCVAMVIGIFAQNHLSWDFWFWMLVIAGGVGIMFLRRVMNIGLVFLIIGSAGFYSESRQFVSDRHVAHWQAYYRKQPVVLRGVILNDPQRRQVGAFDKTTFDLRCVERQSPWGWQPCTGKLRVQLFRAENLAYGDYVQIQGRLHRPFAGDDAGQVFSYKSYLHNRGIDYMVSVKNIFPVDVLEDGHGFWLKAQGIKWRHYFAGIFQRFLSPKESGLIQAMLLGDRSGVPDVVNDLFQRTGTAHILAISGLHIGVLAGLILIAVRFLPIGRHVHYVLVVFCLLFYLVMTGGRASVWRATVMAVIFFGGLIFEKEDQRWNTLALAAIVILVMNPRNLFDVGFLLSFLCVGFIFLMVPLLNRLDVIKRGWIRCIVQSVIISFSVWVGVWPLIALAFGLIVPIGVLANLWVIPWVSLVLGLSLGIMVTGSFFPWLAGLFAVCLRSALNILVGGVYLISQIPGGVFEIKDVNIWYVWSYYVLVLVFLIVGYSRKRGAEMGLSLIDKGSQLC